MWEIDFVCLKVHRKINKYISKTLDLVSNGKAIAASIKY